LHNNKPTAIAHRQKLIKNLLVQKSENKPASIHENEAIQALNAALPQTQCTRCGYPSCMAYAQAIHAGEAQINQCPPGGNQGVARLAALTRRPALPLNPHHGQEGPRMLAVIDEQACIGCTLCIKACPVDSIFGAAKKMHTVIDAWCTGCELCLPACPVDCIELVNITPGQSGWNAWSPTQATQAQQRFEFHQLRLSRQDHERQQQLAANPLGAANAAPSDEHKQAVLQAAMARARARRV
jgi:Na+-translocating ferredoxin:NAD+ oxidoreductase subunit B